MKWLFSVHHYIKKKDIYYFVKFQNSKSKDKILNRKNKKKTYERYKEKLVSEFSPAATDMKRYWKMLLKKYPEY